MLFSRLTAVACLLFFALVAFGANSKMADTSDGSPETGLQSSISVQEGYGQTTADPENCNVAGHSEDLQQLAQARGFAYGNQCGTKKRAIVCCKRCCEARSHGTGSAGKALCKSNCSKSGLCCKDGGIRCRAQGCGQGQC